MQVAGVAHHYWLQCGKNVSAKHEHWNGVFSRNFLDQAIKLSSTYFDDKSKTSKLLILISDGEDHSEGAQAAAEEANKQEWGLLQ
jgi:hypothetical protein